MKALKIIFMGTPLFALPALEQLHRSAHSLEAVVTQPDRPRGRGRAMRPSPVKEWALERGISLLQPARLREGSFIQKVRAAAPDLIAVVAYGLILPEELLQLPPLGCINLHASLLPVYRGAAPIERAVMEGAEETGVTIIALTPELDAGEIILQERHRIAPADTAGEVGERLSEAGAGLLRQAVDQIAAGKARRRPQDHGRATYASPLTAGEGRLDWSESASEICNRIRGLNPRPGAYTTFRGKRLKIWRAAPSASSAAGVLPRSVALPPGCVEGVAGGRLTVACGGGTSLDLLELQPAGKKRLPAADFCCGYHLCIGTPLGE